MSESEDAELSLIDEMESGNRHTRFRVGVFVGIMGVMMVMGVCFVQSGHGLEIDVPSAPVIQLVEKAGFCDKEVAPKKLTCAEVKAQGKCGKENLKNKCCETCDESNCPECMETLDLAVAAANCEQDDWGDCAQQKEWGKCGSSWMTGHCCKTCGQKSCPACQGGQKPAACANDDWANCPEQKKMGKCDRSWMRGHCCKSCGKESCPACQGGGPSPAPPPPPSGGACTMKVLRNVRFDSKYKTADVYYCTQWTSGTRRPVIFGHGCCGGNSGQGWFVSKMILAKGFPLISVNYNGKEYNSLVPALLKYVQQGKLRSKGIRFSFAKEYVASGYSLGGIMATGWARQAGRNLKGVIAFGSIQFMGTTWTKPAYYPPMFVVTTTGDGGDDKIKAFRAKGISMQVLKYPGHHGSYFKLGDKFKGQLQKFLQQKLR